MKNLMKFSFMAVMMTGLLFTTSCGDDDEPVIENPTMIITTTPSANADGVVEVEVGEELAITVVASTPAGFNTIRISNGTTVLGEQTRTDLGLDVTDLTGTADFLIALTGEAGATATLTVTVVDEASSATEDIEVLLVAPPSPPIRVFTAQLIYAPAGDGSTASWFSTNLGRSVTEAEVNAAADPGSMDIDFGYYATSTPEFGFAAPNTFDRPGISIADWTTKNATSFKKVALTSEEYIAIKVGTDLAEVYTDSSDTAVEDMKFEDDGNFLSFKLDDGKDGKYGLIEIVQIVDANDDGDFFDNGDYVEIEVLVEE